MAQNICISKNIQELNILTFWEILKSDNVALLDENYNELKEYTEEETKLFEETWVNISDEYFNIKNDGKAKMVLRKRHEQLILSEKIRLLAECIDHMKRLFDLLSELGVLKLKHRFDEVLEVIKKIEPKIRVNKKLSLEHNRRVITKAYESLMNKYTLKYKRPSEEVKETVKNVFDVVANVEQVLERSLGDIRSISVAQWLAYEKIAENKIKKIKRRG